jgi:hypothetical protein
MDDACGLTSLVVRAAHLPAHLRPVQIWSGDPPEPLPAVAATITHRKLSNSPRSVPLEGYDLELWGDDGRRLTCLQYETLEIALDQAHAVLGIDQADWAVTTVVSQEPEALPAALHTIRNG